MGQSEIFEFLEKHSDKWFTTKEICKALGLSQSSVSVSLRVLRHRKEIRFLKEEDHGKLIFYKSKE